MLLHNQKMYYVYHLIDPRDAKVFYVGKGKGRRAWHHAELVKRGKTSGNLAKDAIISEIHLARKKVKVSILAEYEDEADAFAREIELIANTPDLCNIRKGGEGWSLSPDEAERRAAIRAERVEQFRRRQTHKVLTHKVLSKFLTWADRQPGGVTFPIPDGDRRADEYVAMVREIVAEYSASV